MADALRSSDEALRQKSAQLEQVYSALPFGLFRTDERGQIVMVNACAERLIQRGDTASRGEGWLDPLMPDDRDKVIAAMDAVADGRAREFALECPLAGEARWLRIHGASSGEGRSVIGVIEDISDRRRAELDLERTREFLRAVLDLLPVGVYARDSESRFVLENAYAVAFLNGGETSILGKTLAEVFGEEYASRARDEDRDVIARGSAWSKEGEFIDLGGDRHWVRMYKRGLQLSSGDRYLVGVNIDLTERHQLEMEARHAKEFLSALLDALPTPLFVKSSDYTYHMVNRAFGKMHGRPATEFKGLRDADFMAGDRVRDNLEMNKRLTLGGPSVAIEERVRHHDGRYAWMLKSKALIGLPDGRHYIVGVMQDIDELVAVREELREHRDNLQALVEQRTEELVIARDLAQAASRAKSEFLANMSHELRTPMHGILSFSSLGRDLAAQSSSGTEKSARYFERIHASANRLMNLLSDLLDIARLEAGRMEYALVASDVHELVNHAVKDIDALTQGKDARILISPGQTASVYVDLVRMGQVLRNLLSNAIKFSPTGGAIEIAWRTEDTSDGMVHIWISDAGVGIPKAELASIFDKFVQSSKTQSGAGGTGLGLSICREIVLAHGGRIWAENNAQAGATFHVRLPSTASRPHLEKKLPVEV